MIPLLRALIVHPFGYILSLKNRTVIYNRKIFKETKPPFIILSNHAAFLDSIYFISAVPYLFKICGARPVYFSTPPKRALMRLLNILEVKDHKQYLRDCSELLSEGQSLLIYPEMGRNADKMGNFKIWAAEVALENNVPIIPCYIYGTTKGHSGPIRIIVGEAFMPDLKQNAQTLTDIFYAKIKKLAKSKS